MHLFFLLFFLFKTNGERFELGHTAYNLIPRNHSSFYATFAYSTTQMCTIQKFANRNYFNLQNVFTIEKSISTHLTSNSKVLTCFGQNDQTIILFKDNAMNGSIQIGWEETKMAIPFNLLSFDNIRWILSF